MSAAKLEQGPRSLMAVPHASTGEAGEPMVMVMLSERQTLSTGRARTRRLAIHVSEDAWRRVVMGPGELGARRESRGESTLRVSRYRVGGVDRALVSLSETRVSRNGRERYTELLVDAPAAAFDRLVLQVSQ